MDTTMTTSCFDWTGMECLWDKCKSTNTVHREPTATHTLGGWICNDCGRISWKSKPENEGKRRTKEAEHKIVWRERMGGKFLCHLCHIRQNDEMPFHCHHLHPWEVYKERGVEMDKWERVYDRVEHTIMLCSSCHSIVTALYRKTMKMRRLFRKGDEIND